MSKLKRLTLSKIYLMTYAFVISIILFTQESQINYSQSHNTISYKIYIFSLLIGIIINLGLAIYINSYNGFKLTKVILVTLIFIIPLLFMDAKVLSPIIYLFILMIMNAKIIEPSKFLKVDISTRVILTIIIILLFIFNLYPTPAREVIISRYGVMRYGLGFVHPNALANVILGILLSYVLLTQYKKYNYKLRSTLFLIIMYLFVFITTDCREFEVVGVILIVVYIINNCISKTYIFQQLIKLLIFPVIAFVLIISVSFAFDPDLNNPFFYRLNELTSDRLYYELQAFTYYPVRLFGYISTPLLHSNFSHLTINIDNFYMALLVHCGVLGLIIFVYVLLKLGYLSIKHGNIYTNISVIIISLAFISIYTNELYAPLIYIVALSNQLYKNKEIRNN